MPTLRHPRTLDDVDGHPPRTIPSAAVGERVTVDESGEFEVDDASDARDLADAYGVELERLVVDEADAEPKAAGDPTPDEQIRAGICPWCDEYEGDHVGQHASSAHPDAWDAYNEADA